MSGDRFFVRLYRAGLVLLPGHVRDDYGSQMLISFEDVLSGATRVRKPIIAFAMTLELLITGLRERVMRFPIAVSRFRNRGPVKTVTRAARGLIRAPAFSLVAILTVAVGVGANAAVFSMLKGVFFEPLPYEDPDAVVYATMVYRGENGQRSIPASVPEFLEYRSQTREMIDVAGFWAGGSNLGGLDAPVRIDRVAATYNLLSVLGVTPVMGRGITEEDDSPSAARVALVSRSLWQNAFGGDSSVIGRTVLLDDRATTVIGVLPADFRLPSTRVDVIVPTRIDRSDPGRRSSHWLTMMGRLRPGSTSQSANAEVERLVENWTVTYPGIGHEPSASHLVVLQSARDRAFGDVTAAASAITVAVLLVLLVAAVNVANLMYVRTEQRVGEMAVRRALGASRPALVYEGLSEVVVLSLAAGLAGVAAAAAVHGWLMSFAPDPVRILSPGIDLTVVAFGLVVAFVVSLAGAVLPLWRSTRADVRAVLNQSSRSATSGRSRMVLRRGMIALETCLAVVLVGLAVMLSRSVGALLENELGFSAESVVAADIALPSASYSDEGSLTAFFDGLRNGVARTPGVSDVGIIRSLPLRETPGWETITLSGAVGGPSEGQHWNAQFQVASAGYTEALGIPILEGRSIKSTDRAGSPPVVVINQTMARTYWPNGNAVGATIQMGSYESNPNPLMRIVGIVGDVRQSGVESDPAPQMFVPRLQSARIYDGFATRDATLVVRSTLPEAQVIEAMRAELMNQDPNVPLYAAATMEQVVQRSLGNRRFASTLLTAFAVVAVALGALGTYGIVSFSVARRRKEIGLRLALGETSVGMARRVVGSTAATALAGAMVGCIGVVLGGGALDSLLYGLESTDPQSLIASICLLTFVSALAAAVPATRASRVDPAETLKAQ